MTQACTTSAGLNGRGQVLGPVKSLYKKLSQFPHKPQLTPGVTWYIIITYHFHSSKYKTSNIFWFTSENETQVYCDKWASIPYSNGWCNKCHVNFIVSRIHSRERRDMLRSSDAFISFLYIREMCNYKNLSAFSNSSKFLNVFNVPSMTAVVGFCNSIRVSWTWTITAYKTKCSSLTFDPSCRQTLSISMKKIT